MPFHCVIVTPEQQMLDASASQVILPAHDGLVGILTDHAPLLARLGTGPLAIDLPGGKSRVFYVDGGVAQMKDNELTVVTNEAISAEDIDVESARAEYAEASARHTTDEFSARQRELQMERARIKQRVASGK